MGPDALRLPRRRGTGHRPSEPVADGAAQPASRLVPSATDLPGLRFRAISNMTQIEGDAGFIVTDPLTCVETARAAIDLVRAHLGDRPVTAVIFSHSHADHFGGVRPWPPRPTCARAGSRSSLRPGSTSTRSASNVHAGVAMRRFAPSSCSVPACRADPGAHVTTGPGLLLPCGTTTLIEPNDADRDDGYRAGPGRRPVRLPVHPG
ncbi:MBL fold metallo-hydrolase [Pseudonocardia sp. MCCB 268]|nr:MBL fold metallo-hydrolase [Pseudonocardia cytotoxica]